MSQPWYVRRSEPLYANKIFRVRADWCADPRSGKEQPFWVIDSNDWVIVIARTAERGEYIMVSQWRFGVRSPSLEVPGGVIDAGEDPATAATRELVEETGYVPGRLVSLGHVDPNPAIMANRAHIFVAEECRLAAESERRHMDATEHIDMRLVSQAELDGLIAGGQVRHAVMLAALLKYRLHGAT